MQNWDVHFLFMALKIQKTEKLNDYLQQKLDLVAKGEFAVAWQQFVQKNEVLISEIESVLYSDEAVEFSRLMSEYKRLIRNSDSDEAENFYQSNQLEKKGEELLEKRYRVFRPALQKMRALGIRLEILGT